LLWLVRHRAQHARSFHEEDGNNKATVDGETLSGIVDSFPPPSQKRLNQSGAREQLWEYSIRGTWTLMRRLRER